MLMSVPVLTGLCMGTGTETVEPLSRSCMTRWLPLSINDKSVLLKDPADFRAGED